jgi:hypothetical protein
MMEKVWAKINGNYERIIAGQSQEAFDSILGAPGIYYSMTGTSIGYSSTNSSTITVAKNNAWNLISVYDAANYILGCSVGSSNSYGLVNGHAYSLIGAYTIKNLTTGAVLNRLYKIRNPWGTDVYTGNWNDADTVHWTANAISQTGFTKNTADGDFWIEYLDFVQAFSSFSVAFYKDAYVNSYKEILSDVAGTSTAYKFTVTTAGEYYVGVEFYDTRMYPTACKSGSASTSYGTLTIATSSGTSLYSATVYDSNGLNYVDLPSLAAGNYSITVKMTQWGTNDTKDYTIRVYGTAAVTFTVMSSTDIAAAASSALTTALSNGASSNSPAWNYAYTYYNVKTGF